MNPTILGISGLSECGKSTTGRYLESLGLKRLKIMKFMNQVKAEDGSPDEDYGKWISRARAERRDWLMEQFTDKLLTHLDSNNISAASIESLYDPVLAGYLKRKFGPRFVILFIDIPREIRLSRQVIREKLNSIEEAIPLLDPRDEVKIAWGALDVMAMADEVVDNSGTVQDLTGSLNGLLKRHGVYPITR